MALVRFGVCDVDVVALRARYGHTVAETLPEFALAGLHRWWIVTDADDLDDAPDAAREVIRHDGLEAHVVLLPLDMRRLRIAQKPLVPLVDPSVETAIEQCRHDRPDEAGFDRLDFERCEVR